MGCAAHCECILLHYVCIPVVRYACDCCSHHRAVRSHRAARCLPHLQLHPETAVVDLVMQGSDADTNAAVGGTLWSRYYNDTNHITSNIDPKAHDRIGTVSSTLIEARFVVTTPHSDPISPTPH